MKIAVAGLTSVGVLGLLITLAAGSAHVILSLGAIHDLALSGGDAAADVAAETRVLATQLIVLVIGFAGAMAIVAIVIVGFVVPPLRVLPQRMRQIGSGAFSERVTLSGYKELDDLADATNEMTASLAMRETQLKHAERLASLGTLVAGVAHEINNPLTYLRGNDELALLHLEELAGREDLPLADRQAFVETADRLRVNVRGYDQLARLSSSLKLVGRGRREPEVLDAGEIVNACVVLAHSRFKGLIEIELDLRARQRIRCEPGEISQVVLNLMLNACDAIDGHGKLRLATRDDGAQVEIVVEDDGPGIPERLQGRIFHAFVSSKPNGTGLGLALSKQIVEAHGGTIRFQTSSSGSTFAVLLPAAASPTTRAAPRPIAPTRG